MILNSNMPTLIVKLSVGIFAKCVFYIFNSPKIQ